MLHALLDTLFSIVLRAIAHPPPPLFKQQMLPTALEETEGRIFQTNAITEPFFNSSSCSCDWYRINLSAGWPKKHVHGLTGYCETAINPGFLFCRSVKRRDFHLEFDIEFELPWAPDSPKNEIDRRNQFLFCESLIPRVSLRQVVPDL